MIIADLDTIEHRMPLTPVRLQASRLAVFWPEDGHAPRIAAGRPCLVRKIVVQVALRFSG